MVGTFVKELKTVSYRTQKKLRFHDENTFFFFSKRNNYLEMILYHHAWRGGDSGCTRVFALRCVVCVIALPCVGGFPQIWRKGGTGDRGCARTFTSCGAV